MKIAGRHKIIALGTVGLLVAPVAVAASTATTTINSVISPVISLFTTSGTVNLNVTPTAAGAQTTASDTVTISTNDSAGYTLKLSGTTTNTNLVSGANNIAATTGTPAAPIALTSGTWGYRLDSASGFGAGPTSVINSAVIGALTYAGVPSSATPGTLATTAAVATNAVTTVWYSTADNYSVPSGTYTQQVTYTATAN